MSPLEPLAPDQRAVVSLVLQQGRSYDEIAALLGMPVEAVRARAQAGLAALARDDGLSRAVTGPLADYLLGQQPPGDAEATRALLAESRPARAWASDVAARLEDVAPRGLPEIPGGDDAAETAAAGAEPSSPAAGTAAAQPAAEAEPSSRPATETPAPRPRPVRAAEPAREDSPPAASRVGGALLIAAVLAAVAVVLFLVFSGGDGDEQVASSPTPAASATPTPSAAPARVADEIPLRSTTGGNAKGTMTVYLQDEQLLFALEAQDVPPSAEQAAYAVWFTRAGGKPRRLGFTNPVGADGRLGIQGPSEKDLADFPRLYATFERVVVSEETEDAKRPTKVILSGKLPKGR
jgi:hypothetical protein